MRTLMVDALRLSGPRTAMGRYKDIEREIVKTLGILTQSVLFVGKLSRRRNVLALIDAFIRLKGAMRLQWLELPPDQAVDAFAREGRAVDVTPGGAIGALDNDEDAIREILASLPTEVVAVGHDTSTFDRLQRSEK